MDTLRNKLGLGIRMKVRWFRTVCRRRYGMTPTQLGMANDGRFDQLAAEYNVRPLWRKVVELL